MFDKLDAYNLVANLVPGAALVYALHFSNFPTPSPEDLGAFLLASFVAGVMTNRLGSLLVDPFLRWRCFDFLKPKDYKSFVTAEKDDQKLETLVANAGLYRTFFTSGLVYLLLMAGDLAFEWTNTDRRFGLFLILAIGMMVSLYALRKEDNYIKARLDSQSPRE